MRLLTEGREEEGVGKTLLNNETKYETMVTFAKGAPLSAESTGSADAIKSYPGDSIEELNARWIFLTRNAKGKGAGRLAGSLFSVISDRRGGARDSIPAISGL